QVWPGYFFFSSRRRHTTFSRDWSSDVCSSDLTIDEVASCDYLVPCIPIDSYQSMLSTIKPLLKQGTVVVDICSVKEEPVRIIREIGRASCRERASISGLAAAMNRRQSSGGD